MEMFVTCNDEKEGDIDVATIKFERVDLDWSKVSPDQVREIQNNWQQALLPNGEKILLRLQYGNQYDHFVLDVKQGEKGLISLSGKEIAFCAFTTLKNLGVGLQFHASEQKN